jgi:hypothetical protein
MLSLFLSQGPPMRGAREQSLGPEVVGLQLAQLPLVDPLYSETLGEH